MVQSSQVGDEVERLLRGDHLLFSGRRTFRRQLYDYISGARLIDHSEKEGVRWHDASRETARGWYRCARCQAALGWRAPILNRSGPVRETPSRCG